MKIMTLIISLIIITAYSCQDPGEITEPTPIPKETPGPTPDPTPIPEETPGPTQEPTQVPEETPGPTLEPSPSPGIIPPVVTHVKATKLQYTDRIRISWDMAAGAESYIVYRYGHKSENSLNGEFPVTTNYIDDTSAQPDTPYFYKVVSIINTVSSDVSANFAEGIYSSFIDLFEPNDTLLHAEEISTRENTAGMYSFTRGEAQDKDWYVYSGSATMMNIKVIIPSGSSLNGELTLEIENNGNFISLVQGENTLGYSGPDDLSFSVSFNVVDPDIDVIGSYTLYIEPIL